MPRHKKSPPPQQTDSKNSDKALILNLHKTLYQLLCRFADTHSVSSENVGLSIDSERIVITSGLRKLMPKVIVFDIDYTLWPLWIDTHSSGPPFKQNDSGNGVLDRSNYLIQFYPHVPLILNYLRNELPEIKLCLASRTNEPKWARAVLELIIISTDPTSARTSSHSSSKRAISYFPYQEIYPGSKITHFRQLSSKTKEDFESMLFFDDEYRNVKEVGGLSVSCWHVDEDIGVNIEAFLKGIESYLNSRLNSKS